MAAKKHLTLRIDEEVVQALDTWAEEHGTSRTDAITTAITALTEAQEAAEGQGRAETHGSELKAVCEALKASNVDLRAEVSRLWSQLAEKDTQIQSLTGIANHAQQLHAAEVARALPGEGEGKTWRQRLAAIFGRGE